MKYYGTLLMIFFFAWCSITEQVAGCRLDYYEKGMHQLLKGINDYSIEATIAMEEVTAHSIIKGKRPDHLSIKLQMKQPAGISTVTTIFDGTYQWIESKTSSGLQVLRLKLEPLTTKNRPFDTNYYLMGTGLLNGEDFPSTIKRLLFLYNLKPLCFTDKVTLSGPINRENLKRYAKFKNSTGLNATLIDKFAKTFGYITLEIDPSSFVIRKYALGSRKGQSTFTVKFESIATNLGQAHEDFSYSPPKNINIQDITNIVKSKIRNHE